MREIPRSGSSLGTAILVGWPFYRERQPLRIGPVRNQGVVFKRTDYGFH